MEESDWLDVYKPEYRDFVSALHLLVTAAQSAFGREDEKFLIGLADSVLKYIAANVSRDSIK